MVDDTNNEGDTEESNFILREDEGLEIGETTPELAKKALALLEAREEAVAELSRRFGESGARALMAQHPELTPDELLEMADAFGF